MPEFDIRFCSFTPCIAMSKSVAFLFFIRNVLIAAFTVLCSVRIATAVRLISAGQEFGLLDFLQGFGEDLWYLLIIGFPLYISGRIIFTFHQRGGKVFVLCMLVLLLFIQIGLNEYFLTVHQIVDASIFNFSFDELKKTVGLSQRFSLLTVLGLLFVIALFVFVYRKLGKGKNPYVVSQSYFAIAVGALAWMFLPLYNSNKEVAATELGVESNASLLLLHSSLSADQTDKFEKVSLEDFKDLDPSFTNGKMSGTEYPLFRPSTEQSSLAKILNKAKTKPNLVYIIVEGLSSDFVGEKADLCGHFMPFLDSLSAQSLYYPNALSTSQRTQNVLPSTLCSVPNVTDGVVFQQMEYPNHYSAQGLLKKEYSTGFYCGVQLEYMNMRGFMNEHSVKRLSGKWSKKAVKEAEKLNSPWGMPDGILFNNHLSEIKKVKGKPFFDALLTISTHDPYVYPDKEGYTQRLLEKLSGIPENKFTSEIKANAEKFASYMYLDEQLKFYFEKFSKKPEFRNTIFVITGDHGSELWNRSALSKYHVPIMVYSPLLKRARRIESIVSHLDVAPSILAMLKQQYGVKLPNSTAFIGKQLLLSESSESRSFVFTTDQLKVKDICYKKTFLLDHELYTLNNDFSLKKIQNGALLKKLNDQKELYRKLSQYVLFGNHLIPNEEYSEYYESINWKDVSTSKVTIDKDYGFREIAGIAKIDTKTLKNRKLKLTVQIRVENNRMKSQDSLPDLVMSKAVMNKMDRKKAVYRMIRPVKVGQEKKFSIFRYVVIFDAAQLSREKKMKGAFLYLYYKMHDSPRVIEAETVISKTK